MRIRTLTIEGFRAFGRSVMLDLDAEAVVIVGANGSGKTSVFDAILWALTGKVVRLGGVEAPVLSMWSESGEARVQLALMGDNGDAVDITRGYDGRKSRMTLTVGNEQVPDALAAGTLVKYLWPVGLNNPDASDALALALTRAVYLQQDNVRDFIDADSDEDRFRAISELIGAGAVTQLQSAMERSRNQWTRATTAMSQDLLPLRERVAFLEADLDRLSSPGPDAKVGQEWPAWLESCVSAGVEARELPPWSSPVTANVGEEIMRELGAVERQMHRRETELQNLLAELRSTPQPPVPDIPKLNEEVSRLRAEIEASRLRLVALRQEAAERSRQETVQAEQVDDLRRLAAIALRHLEERCPVCDQNYDRDSTRKRLEGVISSAAPVPADTDGRAVAEVAQSLSSLEAQLATREADLETASQIHRDITARATSNRRRLADLGFADPAGAPEQWLEAELSTAREKLQDFVELRAQGERLLVERARMAEISRRGEVETELERARLELAQLEGSIAQRESTKDLASKIIEALRSAGDELVRERLRAVEPVARRIYRRIDPHPAFTTVHLRSWLLRGRGHMAPQLEDPISQTLTEQPGLVLSSSQANALAVAIFLAVNLGVGNLPLDAALLDDPLQSLDDVNLLGLIDLIRRVKQQRQLVISTHDRRFGQLLARKLRPTTDGRTVVIELRDWQREGPQILQQSLQPAERTFQVVA